MYAGVDWSTSGHDVAVVSRGGEVVAQFKIRETPDGVARLLRELSSVSRRGRRQVPVGIETRHGLLVAALRAAGQPVVEIDPTRAARYRGRLSPARHKSDKGDARLLAHILRVDGRHFRSLPSLSEDVLALGVLTHAQRRALRDRQRVGLRLRSHLRMYHPQMVTAFDHLPGKLLRVDARAVMRAAPTPAAASALTYREIVALLAGASPRGRGLHVRADHLHTAFEEPYLTQLPAVERAMAGVALALLDELDALDVAVADLTDEMVTVFDRHPDAPIYRSFPGMGPILGARHLAEIGDDRNRFANAKGLRAYAGAAPLTWASGGSRVVTHRRAANKLLKGNGFLWAFSALTASPGARAHYDRRRERGDRHAAALRHLNARLLTCLYHCLAHRVLYDEQTAFPERPAETTEPAAEPGAEAPAADAPNRR